MGMKVDYWIRFWGSSEKRGNDDTEEGEEDRVFQRLRFP